MSPRPDAAPRARCAGVAALSARLEPWQLELCDRPELIGEWLAVHGSPVNLIDPAPMARNAAELSAAAARFGIELGIHFARKANKALALVDEAWRLGLGIDLASERELAQVLARGVPARMLVMTAAVKPVSLLELCAASGTTVVVDNADELRSLASVAGRAGRPTPVALRLGPVLGDGRPVTRFGFAHDEAIAAVSEWWPPGADPGMTMAGVHFHLDGYDPAERVVAVAQAVELVDALRALGHDPAFVDIGGGIPMSYLDSPEQWEHFWTEHRAAVLGHRDPLTFDGHGLGMREHGGEIFGRPAVYPFHQAPTRGDWLAEVLGGRLTTAGRSRSVAEALTDRGLQLRCEPGRALVDGCGLTAARVAFRKRRGDGTWLIGVEMNRTQCRSTSDDFLVDPLLLRPERTGEAATAAGPPTGPIEGYLVGAYCIERELLTWRRLRFPDGVDVGDVVVFPNTAGYLMHILESSSHQIPLARNLVVTGGHDAVLDEIDAGRP